MFSAANPTPEKEGLPDALARLLDNGSEKLPSKNEIYLVVTDKGLVKTGEHAFLESNYSPDRLAGMFYSLHVLADNVIANGYRRHNPTPRVYMSSHEYVSNFVSPLKSSKAETLEFVGDKKSIDEMNTIFAKLIDPYSDKNKENARIQLCNSLYWYMEYLNASDWSLQCVFLVSAVDSLFPPRVNMATNGKTTPSVNEKAPMIADAASFTEGEKQENTATIEKLFSLRNEVIHGKIEIQGFNKTKKKENATNKATIESSEGLLKLYLHKRLNRLTAS